MPGSVADFFRSTVDGRILGCNQNLDADDEIRNFELHLRHTDGSSVWP